MFQKGSPRSRGTDGRKPFKNSEPSYKCTVRGTRNLVSIRTYIQVCSVRTNCLPLPRSLVNASDAADDEIANYDDLPRVGTFLAARFAALKRR